MNRRNLRLSSRFMLAAAAVFLAASTASAMGQATTAASKSLDIDAFAGYSRINPDYGLFYNNGFTFGVDVTRYFRFPVVPSLEGRVNMNNRAAGGVNMRSYLVGIKAEYPLHRYHPYVAFLVGPGTLHYNYDTHIPGYTGDNSIVYSYGAGVDIDIVKNISFKGDYMAQSWNLGNHSGQPVTLSPTIYTIGVQYRVPFRKYTKQSDYFH